MASNLPLPESKGNQGQHADDHRGNYSSRLPRKRISSEREAHEREHNTDGHEDDANPVELQDSLEIGLSFNADTVRLLVRKLPDPEFSRVNLLDGRKTKSRRYSKD
jgi:hypothetical protein